MATPTNKQMAIEFQVAAAGSAEQARLLHSGADRYIPRVVHAQQCAADYYFLARKYLDLHIAEINNR